MEHRGLAPPSLIQPASTVRPPSSPTVLPAPAPTELAASGTGFTVPNPNPLQPSDPHAVDGAACPRFLTSNVLCSPIASRPTRYFLPQISWIVSQLSLHDVECAQVANGIPRAFSI